MSFAVLAEVAEHSSVIPGNRSTAQPRLAYRSAATPGVNQTTATRGCEKHTSSGPRKSKAVPTLRQDDFKRAKKGPWLFPMGGQWVIPSDRCR